MAVPSPWMQPPGPIRVGISACLLGQAVRWDGTDHRDAYLVETLGPQVEFVPVCPEAAIGLGVPRPPIRQVADGSGSTRALGVEDPDLDVSAALRAHGRRMAAELGDLAAYVLKRGSPSCGLQRVKLYRPSGGRPALRGTGLYAQVLRTTYPQLPMEEEGSLADPALRDAFIERLFVYRRWRALLATGLTRARLAEFHRLHALALKAHGLMATQRLEHLALRGGPGPMARLGAAYGAGLMDALHRPATRAGHARVLQGLLRLLRRGLDVADEAELAASIEAYRTGQVPRTAPLVLLRHHIRRHPHPAAAGQAYLVPDPLEERLRFGA